MSFTLRTAWTPANCNLILSLERTGNEYRVNLTDKSTWRTISESRVGSYDVALDIFSRIADKLDMIAKDVDNSEAYAYIDSQYH